MFGLMAAAMTSQTQPTAESGARPPALLPGLRLPPVSQPATAPADGRPDGGHLPVSIPELKRATAYTEAVVHLWERAMFAVAGGVGLTGLASLLTRRKRPCHLIAAALILASTGATLIGLALLVDPERGALPPLPVRLYFYVGIIQSAYGWVLLALHARPGRRPQQVGTAARRP